MGTRSILYNEEARKAIKNGVDKVANAVKVTLGAKGRTVIVGHKYGSKITKDGISVARAINLEDEIEAIGANIIKEVSQNTVAQAGDGTTSAMIIAQAILHEGFKLSAAGHNTTELKSGIDKAVKAVVEQLKVISTPVDVDSDKLKQISIISANNDEEIGSKIAEAYKLTGKDGIISIDDSTTGETYIKSVEGMQFERGYISPFFVNDESTLSVQFEKPYILVCAGKISTGKEILPIFGQVVKSNNAPFLIIAEDVVDEALGIILTNRIKGPYPICVIKSPGFGDNQIETLRDICALTGATLVNDETGVRLDTLTLEQLGKSDKVLVTKDETTIVGGAGDKNGIEARKDFIRKSIEQSPDEREQNLFRNRLAKLSGGIAILYVGASSEVELGEKKDRCDDALRATGAALEEGIVPGGGIALIRCDSILENLPFDNDGEREGIKLIRRVLSAPFRQMVENSGLDINISNILSLSQNFGYNFKTDKVEDLVESGVVDPTKVVRVALVNAASVSGVLLTSESLIVNVDDPNQIMPQFKR